MSQSFFKETSKALWRVAAKGIGLTVLFVLALLIGLHLLPALLPHQLTTGKHAGLFYLIVIYASFALMWWALANWQRKQQLKKEKESNNHD